MSINSVPASEHLTHSRKYMRLGLPIDRISHHCVANCAFSAGEISIRHSPSVCFSDLTASKMFLASRFASSRISLWVWRQRPGWRVPQGWHSRRAVVHCSCGKGAPSRFSTPPWELDHCTSQEVILRKTSLTSASRPKTIPEHDHILQRV